MHSEDSGSYLLIAFTWAEARVMCLAMHEIKSLYMDTIEKYDRG